MALTSLKDSAASLSAFSKPSLQSILLTLALAPLLPYPQPVPLPLGVYLPEGLTKTLSTCCLAQSQSCTEQGQELPGDS